MGLFGKKKQNELNDQSSLISSRDLIQFVKINERSDDEVFKICDLILSGKPVVINLDSIMAEDCNFILSFVSGCCYACSGDAIQIQDRLFLFARGEELTDGSLMAWVEENR